MIFRILSRVSILAILSAAIFCPACSELFKSGASPSLKTNQPRASFLVGFEQLNSQGKWTKIPVQNHQVLLEKKTFRVVVFFTQLGSMYVSASQNPDRLKLAQTGYGFAKIFPKHKYKTESFFNPDRLLVLSNKGVYQNWLFSGTSAHRFDPTGISSVGKQGFMCVRTIDDLEFRNGKVNIRDFSGDKIYLVLGQTDHKAGKKVEKQRDWVTILFK